MYILAIDTASSAAGAAIAADSAVLASFHLNVGKTHSERFLPMVDFMLKSAGLALDNISALAVTVGPGSFTGLRIGIATAKAWGQALNLPIVPVTTVEALAFAAGSGGLVCPILDARRDEVYTALFRGREQLSPPEAVSPQKLAERLVLLNEPVAMNGDALPLYKELFAEYLGDNFLPAEEERRVFMAAAVAVIGRERFLRGETVDYQKLEPFYLRSSEAETKLKARSADAR